MVLSWVVQRKIVKKNNEATVVASENKNEVTNSNEKTMSKNEMLMEEKYI